MMHTNRRRSRASFTLVELMVVITIIAILAGLISAAAATAIAKTKQTAIKTELDQIAAALELYKNRYGEYPPDFSNSDRVKRHLVKAFPRITSAERDAIAALDLTPAQALVFWLRGFSPDPTLPHTGGGTRTPIFPFAKERFDPPTAALPTYKPPYGNQDDDGTVRPYIYFHSATYATVQYPKTGTAEKKPYKVDGGSQYVNFDGYQLIAAGLDGKWGDPDGTAEFPSGKNYDTSDFDNLVNFSQRSLEDSIP